MKSDSKKDNNKLIRKISELEAEKKQLKASLDILKEVATLQLLISELKTELKNS